MEKNINYLSRNFDDIKGELINFSKKYYPTLAESFNDSSVGSWFIDLVSAVGDDLSYSIDRAYQENNINSSNLKSSVLNVARMNNVKVPGPKSSMVEVELSCEVGVDQNKPRWKDCPIVKRDTQVGAGQYTFELMEDVDFAEQFNNNGFSNRRFEPNRDTNGAINSYTIYKTVMAVAGTSKIYKRTISANELEPFMEVILPEQNIMNVESIIFKPIVSSSYNPKTYEFYVDAEEFQTSGESVKTYRYFEVNSLSDLYRFDENIDVSKSIDRQPHAYEDYTETYGCNDDVNETSTRTTRIYQGKWHSITQKFVTEYTDNGYLKIIFGASSYDKLPSNGTEYGQYMMSNLMNNKMLGVLPQAGWTMYVRYKVGGGIETNLGVGAINSIKFLNVEFKNNQNAGPVTQSIKVTNISNSVGGKDAPSTEELKYITKYSIGSQERCVTLNDYKGRLAMMPPKYGAPFRYNAIEENNKVVMSFLGLTANGKLDTALPSLLIENIKEYMSHYKNLTDYIEMRSGKVYNLGFEIDVFIDKNYTTEYVIKTIIEKVKEYFDVNNHMMGDSIFVGDIEKEINKLDGVIALIDFRVYNIYGGSYGSNAKFPLYSNDTDVCNAHVVERYLQPKGDAICDRIDLEALDSVLENDYNSLFEILNPNSDICVRCKLK